VRGTHDRNRCEVPYERERRLDTEAWCHYRDSPGIGALVYSLMQRSHSVGQVTVSFADLAGVEFAPEKSKQRSEDR
jgi:hypothetical protein